MLTTAKPSNFSSFFSRIIDTTTNSVKVDYSKCTDCGSCIKTCGGDVLKKTTHVRPVNPNGLKESGCTACGKCAETCPVKAITYTDNLPLFKKAFETKGKAKVGVLDMSILYELEEEFKLPIGRISLTDLLCLLKNLGFDFFLDSTLLCDYDIINDANRLYTNRAKGQFLTVGSFCQSLYKKILKIDPVGSDQVADVFLRSEAKDFTTFVVSGCYAKRGSSTVLKNGSSEFSSVGISPEEFYSIIREKCQSNGIESLFVGSPCISLPLGSREGVRADCAERFTDSVIRTYCEYLLGIKINPLQFSKVDRFIELANFEIFQNQKLTAAVVNKKIGFNKLMKMDLNNLMYISPRECPPGDGPDYILQRKDVEAETRNVKRSWENEAVQKVWKELRKVSE